MLVDFHPLTAKLAGRYDGQLIINFLEAFLPEDYSGNLRDELPEMVRSAKEKGLCQALTYGPADIGPIPFGYTDNGHYVFLHQKKMIQSVLSPNSLMSVPGLCDLAPLKFWLDFQPKYTKDGLPTGQIDHQKIANVLMEECRKAGPFIAYVFEGLAFGVKVMKLYKT